MCNMQRYGKKILRKYHEQSKMNILRVAQLSTYDLCIYFREVVFAHRTPGSVLPEFQASFAGVKAISETNEYRLWREMERKE